MDGFVLIWNEVEKKPKIFTIKIHIKTKNTYCVEFLDYPFEIKFITLPKDIMFCNRNEAQCEVELENEEIIRREKYISI